MYAWVGEALIDTIREACAPDWTPAAEQAWRAAYARITDAVLGMPAYRP